MYRLSEHNFENPNVVYNRVKQIVDRNKASDLFHKAFLRPQEIALKTWRTQNDLMKPHDALPYGLKQVIKADISQDKYILKDFQSFDGLDYEQRNIQFINENNYDNLISLLKPVSGHETIQVCICICMYSEDKAMLRKTLSGVSNNISTFVKNGINPDEIAVVVIMDGIEKVDPTVSDFFGEMEKQSNIYLDNEVSPLEARQMAKDTFNQIDQEEIININNFIFDEVELLDRKKRRFAQRKREFQEVKGMRKKIQILQANKRITFEDLDVFLRPFFISRAIEHKKKDYAGQNNFTLEKISEEQILRQYADNVRKSRPIIYEALSQAKSYCQKYIQTRENLALLNSYRVEIDTFETNRKSKIGEYRQLNEEQKNVSIVKMNLFFITKYKNSGKLSSHNWFFNGFCKQIKAEFAILLDVGLCPQKDALYKMFIHMKEDENCGGVCGYMNLRIERLEQEDQKFEKDIDGVSRFFLHFVDIQRAQQVEYHFSHLVDKPFQALFNFIHVLPGAFSAYRMKALRPTEEEDSSLLRDYFKSLEQSTSQELKKSEFTPMKAFLKIILPDMFFSCCYQTAPQHSQQRLLYESNVFLAEDRTLCMGIHQNIYNLQFLPDAHAWVDPIKNLHGLLGQRKRWINGSFFAFESVKQTMKNSPMSDFCLKVQVFYLTLMNMLAFVAPALFLFTVHVAMFAFRDWFFGQVLRQTNIASNFETTQFYNSFVFFMDFIYIMFMLGLIFKSMHFTHKTQRFIPFIYLCSTILGMFAIAVFIVLLVDVITGIIDSFKCLAQGLDITCSITFLADNSVLREKFFDALPGGVYTFITYKWIVVGIISLYILPISVYAMFFCKWEFVGDVIFGSFSYIFYSPTYLNLLNTFALCRIDDISWGTKGLDVQDTRSKELKQSWKSIKTLHVAKYIFWNITVGAAMLVISSPINVQGLITQNEYNDLLVASYVRKFFMTFGLMVAIGIALLIKIILGAIYNLCYRCKHKISYEPKDKESNSLFVESKVDSYFNDVKGSMQVQMKNYVTRMVEDVKNTQTFSPEFVINNMLSFIKVQKKVVGDAPKKRAQQRWKRNVDQRSRVMKKTILSRVNQRSPTKKKQKKLASSDESHSENEYRFVQERLKRTVDLDVSKKRIEEKSKKDIEDRQKVLKNNINNFDKNESSTSKRKEKSQKEQKKDSQSAKESEQVVDIGNDPVSIVLKTQKEENEKQKEIQIQSPEPLIRQKISPANSGQIKAQSQKSKSDEVVNIYSSSDIKKSTDNLHVEPQPIKQQEKPRRKKLGIF